MAKVIVYYAHPGQTFSRANRLMAKRAAAMNTVTFVDLYADYPRHDIDIDREQARLLDHDVIVFQFPMYWYSTPSILKEWQDLVLQHGFAYGHGGDKLAGKTLLLAVTAGGATEAYSTDGYQNHPIRDFLVPLEQTARLCGMTFAAPYVLFGALKADEDTDLERHVDGYAQLLQQAQTAPEGLAAKDRQAVITADDILTQAEGQ
ncbi:NAD(P)H-dependent oxidoreductase [Pseudooctadecabacter sp.]|uniref:NAD(P)H-dependent oxidoreductase n=1 Tax=Pseudooctadecabacter sp. TaxID=1966338 RepID=UPI0035C82A15